VLSRGIDLQGAIFARYKAMPEPGKRPTIEYRPHLPEDKSESQQIRRDLIFFVVGMIWWLIVILFIGLAVASRWLVERIL